MKVILVLIGHQSQRMEEGLGCIMGWRLRPPTAAQDHKDQTVRRVHIAERRSHRDAGGGDFWPPASALQTEMKDC